MFKIRRTSAKPLVLYLVSGRIDEEAASELQRLFGQEPAGSSVALDLGEARRVDAVAIEFLARCEDSGIKLRNCPAYVREWIANSRRHG